MKQNFSFEFDEFLVIYGNTPRKNRVRCLKCRQWCDEIRLPEFTMYFCESIFCTNTRELRQQKDESWELVDYGAGFKDLVELAQKDLKAQMTPPRGRSLRLVR